MHDVIEQQLKHDNHNQWCRVRAVDMKFGMDAPHNSNFHI